MKTNSLFLKGVMVVLWLFSITTAFAQTPSEVRGIIKDYDLGALKSLEEQFNKEYEVRSFRLEERARALGIPLTLKLEGGAVAELQEISGDGTPYYYRTLNAQAARSTRTNHVNNGGSLGLSLDGQNMVAFVWDGGHPRLTHQGYDGPGGNNRISLGDASSPTGVHFNRSHGAHVTGTIASAGTDPLAKGMASHAQVVNYEWSNDLAEATAAASNGMLLSNHSYGDVTQNISDNLFGAYNATARSWDALMHNAPFYLMVSAAGNDGVNNFNGQPLGGVNGFDKLSRFQTAKNGLVVGNANDANVDSAGNLIGTTICPTSSQGPTDDFRIKPDIVGNGVAVYSTLIDSDTHYDDVYNNNPFNPFTGTSMASPNVMGSLLLVQQHYNNVKGDFMRAASLKGLALHTADDIGMPGPDAVTGWGLLNAKRAVEAISGEGLSSIVEEHTLQQGGSYSITVNATGVEDLLASISWTDVAGQTNTNLNSSIPRLVNDLDVRITKGSTTFSPFRLTGVTTNGTGDNIVDPYERIDVGNASGVYTITVTHKGSLSGGSQDFSLIVTGVNFDIAPPSNLVASNVTASTVDLDWTASANPNVDGYQVFQNGVQIATTTNNNFTVTGLTPQTTYSFFVRAYIGSELSDPTNTVTITTLADTEAPSVPFFINVTSITETSAALSWTASIDNVGVVGYDVFLDGVFIGFTPTNSYPLSGLTASTYYDVYVRARDASNNVSAASPTRTFRTLGLDCGVTPSLPYTEGFETSIGLWTQDPTNTVNWVRNSGSTPGSGPVSGSGSAWYMYVPAIGNSFKSASLVSPCIDLTGETSASFAFDFHNTLSLGPQRFAFQVSRDGVNWDTLWRISDATGLGWATYSVSLSDYLGDVVRFRFRRQVGSNAVLDVAIDNINITATSSSAPYCGSNSSNTAVAYISGVRVGAISNPTGASLAGYGDYTGLSTELSRTSSNAIRVRPTFPASMPNAGIAVYIDWNQDGDFDDFQEQVVSFSGSILGTLNEQFNVPFFATPGATRMRVSFQQGVTVPGPCGILFSGEVEDYTVVIPNNFTGTDTTSGIVKSELNMLLYPNPVRSQFLNVRLENDQPVRYTIFNALGVQIMTASFEGRIDVSNLTSGTYFIEVASDKNVYKSTFIKG